MAIRAKPGFAPGAALIASHDVGFTLYGGLDSRDPKAVCDYLMQQPPAPDAKCVAPPAAAKS